MSKVMESVGGPSGYAGPAPSVPLSRALTSSLFGYFFVALGGYFVANATAKQIAGTEQGIAANLVTLAVWLIAAFVAGLVAGYRSVGKGWMSGLLVGLYTILGLVGFLQVIFWVEHIGWTDLLERLSASDKWIFFTLLALLIPSATYGGLIGDRFFQDDGHLEDPLKHTLFQVPWWHWVWLLIFVPGVVVSDLVLSGHLLLLSFRVAWEHLRHFFFVGDDIFTYVTPIVGFVVIALGIVNLRDGLSIRTEFTTQQRVVKVIWGLVLLIFLVNIMWKVVSKMALAAIGQ